MDYQTQVDRVNELVKIIKDAEAELAGLFGGERPKRKWTRRAQSASEPVPSEAA